MYKDIQTYVEARTLEMQIPGIVKDIMERYNLSTKEGIERALSQATWAGICLGKGWD